MSAVRHRRARSPRSGAIWMPGRSGHDRGVVHRAASNVGGPEDVCDALPSSASPARVGGGARSPSRAASAAHSRAGLRRVPHRPACGGRGPSRRQAARHSRARDRRDGDRQGCGGRSIPDWRSRRRPVARLDLRRLRLLHDRTRKSLRGGALHRLPDRRRLRGVDRRRPSLLFPDPGRLHRRGGRAAAVRRTDRLSDVENGGQRATRRHLWLRRRGAHRGSGGGERGARGLRVHARRRFGGAGVRPRNGGRLGGIVGRTRRPSRSTPR